MTIGKGRLAAAAAIILAAGTLARPAEAWSHQGHILMTRLAVLRIIQDEKAPKELRDLLRAQMPADLPACEKLATVEVVGAEPKDYQTGLDGACTLPDRIRGTPEGRKPLEPYGMPESNMHFLDLEYFAKEISYKADLSNRPKIEDFPHDLKDWRYKQGGFVPFRIEEFYGKVMEQFRAGEKRDVEGTARTLGYLCHYLEDCHQPHHATIDYMSLSYLAGKVPGVREIKTPLSDGGEAISYRSSKGIDPHGDIEFQLFENAEEPRAGFRKEFWKELKARIAKHAPKYALGVDDSGVVPPPYNPFRRSLEILSNSYTYLPAVGKAAQAAYATGTFDPKPFFTSEESVKGEKMTMIQVIAEQNARAVLEVEQTIRRAWDEARKPKPETK